MRNFNNPLHKNYNPIQDYLKAKAFRENRTWIVINGRCVTCVNGVYLDSQEFAEAYPIPNPVHFGFSPENYDKTHDYMK